MSKMVINDNDGRQPNNHGEVAEAVFHTEELGFMVRV
jgi:hypothetical protein